MGIIYQIFVGPFVLQFNLWVNTVTYAYCPVHPIYTLQSYCLKNDHPLQVLLAIPNLFNFYSKNSKKSISNPTRQYVIALGGYNNQFFHLSCHLLSSLIPPSRCVPRCGLPNSDRHLICCHQSPWGSRRGGHPHLLGKQHHSSLCRCLADVSPGNQGVISGTKI